jgi:hypothetical protein
LKVPFGRGGGAVEADETFIGRIKGAPKKRACRLAKINCRCIRGPHFLHEVGIVTQIKPEHIDPHAFFSETEGEE